MFLLSPGKKGRKGRDQKTIHRVKKYQKDVWQVLSCVQYILSYVIINPNTHGPFYVKILAAYVKIYPFVHSVDNRKAWLRETCSVNYRTSLPRSAKVGLAGTSCCCIEWKMQILLYTVLGCEIMELLQSYKEISSISADQNRHNIWAQMRWEGGVEGSQPMRTAVDRRPNKLWRSDSIFNLWSMQSQCECIYWSTYRRPLAWFSWGNELYTQYTGFGDGSDTPVKIFLNTVFWNIFRVNIRELLYRRLQQL